MARLLLKRAASAAALVVAGGGAFAASWRLHDRNAEVSAADAVSTPELIARGEYLVKAANCAACHNAPGSKPFAGGLAFTLPFGTIYSTNLTADRETGIGTWSDDDLVRALHERIGKGTARTSTRPPPRLVHGPAYSDAELAAVANYVIGQFGGKTGAVTAQAVRDRRAAQRS